MANWTDEMTLIKQLEPENRVNENGFANILEEERRTVFCNKKSVGYSEYYKSQQAGYTAQFKVEVHRVDYNNEKLAILEDSRYNILKTYELNQDIIELTLTDLRTQSESVS